LFSNDVEAQEYIKSKAVFLCVLKEQYPQIFQSAKIVCDRLLSALDIDYNNEFTQIDWSHYRSFIKTVVKHEVSRLDAANFVLRVFHFKSKSS